jgi:hypothetical protein
MGSNQQSEGERVTFERGIPAHTVMGSVEGLHLKEFFLLLSSMGLAYRRCELSWINGDQIGVTFLKQGDKKKAGRRSPANA